MIAEIRKYWNQFRNRDGRALSTRRRKIHGKRAIDAGKHDRFTQDWQSSPTTMNLEMRRSLRTVRTRSREMAINDDYMRQFLKLFTDNVIGSTGIRLQVKALKDDGAMSTIGNKIVEDAFKTWGYPETATMAGRFDWIAAQRHAAKCLARDGEVLCRYVAAKNDFGFAIDFIDVAWLDELYNEINSQTGNRIIMSVEVDTWGRPVAYYLTPPRFDWLAAPYDRKQRYRERIDASEILHIFVPEEDEEETRGLPWVASALYRLRQLGKYEEAEVIAARIGACKMGFIARSADDTYQGQPDEEEAGDPPFLEHAEPGIFQELGPGETVSSFDPNHPNSNFDMFHKALMRGIASGVGVSYVSLANDLTGVNFSSIRAGILAEREFYKSVQSFLITHFCRPIYQRWLENAYLAGQLEGLTPKDIKTVANPDWRPRGWPWVDPRNDAQAKLLEVKAGLSSVTDILAEQGEDIEEVFKKIQEERKLAAKYGITLPDFGGITESGKNKDASKVEDQPDQAETADAPAEG
jgi:lambda family phage portal protein